MLNIRSTGKETLPAPYLLLAVQNLKPWESYHKVLGCNFLVNSGQTASAY